MVLSKNQRGGKSAKSGNSSSMSKDKKGKSQPGKFLHTNSSQQKTPPTPTLESQGSGGASSRSDGKNNHKAKASDFLKATIKKEKVEGSEGAVSFANPSVSKPKTRSGAQGTKTGSSVTNLSSPPFQPPLSPASLLSRQTLVATLPRTILTQASLESATTSPRRTSRASQPTWTRVVSGAHHQHRRARLSTALHP